MRAIGPHPLEDLAGLLQFLHLLQAGLAALFLHIEDRIHGSGMTDESLRAGLTQRRFRVFRRLPFRRLPFRPRRVVRARHGVGRRAQPVEHTAHLLRHDLPDNFGDTLAEGNAAPLGITLRRVDLLVIRGHVLGPVARQGANQPILTSEVIAAVMQIHAVAVPRQCDIAGMGVHARGRQHIGAVQRHALRLMDRRRIAVVDAVVIPEVEGHGPAIVGAHGNGLRVDLVDGSERAVLHAQPAFVLQEHDTIPAGEVAFAALDRDTHILAKITGVTNALARPLVEGAHLVIGMGQDDPTPVR